MRLLYKTLLYYIIASLLFFAVAGYIIYINYSKIINDDIDAFLINREEIATTQIINDIPISSLNNYEQRVKLINNTLDLDIIILKDTTLYDIIDDTFHDYRTLNVRRKIGNNYYDITIRKSLIQSNVLVNGVLKTMLLVFLGLLSFLILGNIFISRNVWRPFKESLSLLENYELGSKESLEFSKTSTVEFNQLNQMLNKLIKKIRYDYLNLKEFTENAAHEIQTPLAIIRNKSERLLQSEKLNHDELKQIKSIYNSCLRLSKINRGLTLLTRIESGVFEPENKVNISKILRSQIQHYKEVVELNQISLKANIESEIFYTINPELVEILISNLIRNAIKHNLSSGKIIIKAGDNNISISNTSDNKKIKNEQFKRFRRSNKDSLGLGLSIISKICRICKIKLNYTYQKELHKFSLIFKTDSLQN